MYVFAHKIVLINGPEQEKSFNSDSCSLEVGIPGVLPYTPIP